MKKVLCVESAVHSLAPHAGVKKNEIYTAVGQCEFDRRLFYQLAEMPRDIFYAAILFIELPDLSDEALEKEKEKELVEN